MTGVTQEADGSHDVLVIQFDSAVPSYQLTPSTTGTHFVASGQSVVVAGSVGLVLHISGVTTPGAILQNGDLGLDSGSLQETRLLDTVQSAADFGIGLTRSACPTISTLTGPPRLVIDFPS